MASLSSWLGIAALVAGAVLLAWVSHREQWPVHRRRYAWVGVGALFLAVCGLLAWMGARGELSPAHTFSDHWLEQYVRVKYGQHINSENPELQAAMIEINEKGKWSQRLSMSTCQWFMANGESTRWLVTIDGVALEKASCAESKPNLLTLALRW